MNILIVYERKNREFENSCLLKVELESRGHNCDVFQFYQLEGLNAISKHSYDVIFVPHLYNESEVYRTISRFGKSTRIINLQYEQVLSEKWEKLGHHTPSGLATQFEHICWGPKTSDRLLKAGVPAKNIHEVGAIQLDLLREEYRQSGLVKDSLGGAFHLDSNKKWNLFLSSFTYAEIDQHRLRMNENVAGASLENFVEIHTDSRTEILKWLEMAVCHFPDEIFIYRPHPDELNLKSVEDLSKRYSNFVIICELSAKLWIESADMILSWYSTTLVESHFLGKEYAILRPYPLPGDFDSVLLKKGKFIRDSNELINAMLSGDIGFALDEKDVGDYYSHLNVPAFKSLASIVESKFNNQTLLFKIPIIYKFKSVLVACFLLIHSHVSKSPFKSVFNKLKFYRRWAEEIEAQSYSYDELKRTCDDIKVRISDKSSY
ncbi:hypothetical protein HPY15_12710 [Vibrio cholerae]|uniref:surface carbohydrate biosynthesis protein n=1 Tax=Vibrio cholerae TaxID=666 RepID=UPI000615ADD6|nr:surface carbohydrate biosynthesis protein [Vibrio cholerae]AKB07262.1 surface carbohydrate biosynthesis domain protein [Vibrio cholerae]QKU94022.1 hypothetical protein HPY15_12710 [Vibrio cholerae]BCN20029.1 hypothetical protein [Vibrio cholerae]GHZ00485.1 surface carbohydrate biosynthesis domain protein [Vibrio cholerae]HAS4582640.1 hypothetical protein [Vibrio cholerae]